MRSAIRGSSPPDLCATIFLPLVSPFYHRCDFNFALLVDMSPACHRKQYGSHLSQHGQTNFDDIFVSTVYCLFHKHGPNDPEHWNQSWFSELRNMSDLWIFNGPPFVPITCIPPSSFHALHRSHHQISLLLAMHVLHEFSWCTNLCNSWETMTITLSEVFQKTKQLLQVCLFHNWASA